MCVFGGILHKDEGKTKCLEVNPQAIEKRPKLVQATSCLIPYFFERLLLGHSERPLKTLQGDSLLRGCQSRYQQSAMGSVRVAKTRPEGTQKRRSELERL